MGSAYREAGVIRLGTAPEWLAAIFTGLAFATGAIVIARDRRQRLLDRAELVSCWVESYFYVGDKSEPSICSVVVRNASSIPAYRCVLELLPWHGNQPAVGMQRIYPTLPPDFTTDPMEFFPEPPPPPISADPPPLRLSFHHSSRRWRLESDGRLSQLDRWWWQRRSLARGEG
jgi:hypothetical protein